MERERGKYRARHSRLESGTRSRPTHSATLLAHDSRFAHCKRQSGGAQRLDQASRRHASAARRNRSAQTLISTAGVFSRLSPCACSSRIGIVHFSLRIIEAPTVHLDDSRRAHGTRQLSGWLLVHAQNPAHAALQDLSIPTRARARDGTPTSRRSQ